MKKIVLAAGMLALLAAGCNSPKPASQPPADAPEIKQPAAAPQAPAQAPVAVKIQNVDEALDLLDKNASSESSITAGTDDSDLLSSDAAELNGLTEVPNAN